ncbi:MAG: hypothetical protein MZV70_29160 [Desulfobacterales bacterium]|nr:hypothetical protein [Desulfobacterales bacterium]
MVQIFMVSCDTMNPDDRVSAETLYEKFKIFEPHYGGSYPAFLALLYDAGIVRNRIAEEDQVVFSGISVADVEEMAAHFKREDKRERARERRREKKRLSAEAGALETLQ